MIKPYDRICCLCDDGGVVIFCRGPCKRSFHGNKEDGKRYKCESLNLSAEELETYKVAKGNKRYLCNECKNNRHACFRCGEEGPLVPDPTSKHPDEEQVYQCRIRKCIKFFHIKCFDAAGERNDLICDAHTCHANSCEQSSKKRLISCRLCSYAWHKSCIPQLCLHHNSWMPGA